MSVLTDNPSGISVQGRPRGSSRYARSYHKVSDANLDDRTVFTFLKRHNFHRTLTAFMAESHHLQHVDPLLKIIENGSKSFKESIDELVLQVQAQGQGKQNISSEKLLTLQFFLHIWYCLDHDQLIKARVSHLKEFINKKGEVLSQVPSLLPYFALPYAADPKSHPFLQKIFTQQWQVSLKSLILESSGKKQDHKKDEEWLNIVEDMIETCQQLFGLIDRNSKQRVEKAMERVNLYKYVIEKNRKPKDSRKQDKFNDMEHLDYKNIAQIKSKLAEIQPEKQHFDISAIFHHLQLQIIKSQPYKEDKKYMQELIKHDILNIQLKKQPECIQYEQLRLTQLIGGYFKGRKYLSQHPYLLPSLLINLQTHFGDLHMDRHGLLMLQCSLDTLTRVVANQNTFSRIIKQPEIIYFSLNILVSFKKLFLQGKQTLEPTILAASAFLSEIAIHRQGRQILSRTNYFQTTFELLSQADKMPLNQSLQKILCRSIFLMLVSPPLRLKAKKLSVKDILLDRMLSNESQGYSNIVGYIIERIEMEGEFQECESDEDLQKSIEFDYAMQVNEDVICHRGQFISLKDSRQKNQKKEVKRQGSPEKERKRSLSKRMLHKAGDLRPYSRDKYVRKGHQ